MKLNVLQKLLIFSFIILAGNGITGYIIFKNNQKVLDSARWVRHTEKIIDISGDILSLGKDIETASRGYVITKDSLFLEPLYTAERRTTDYIAQLRQLTQDNSEQQHHVDSLNFYLHKRLDFSYQMVELRNKHGLASAIAYVSSKKGKQYTDHIRRTSSDIQQKETIILNQRRTINEESLAMFNLVLVVTLISMAVFTILLLLIATRNILNQNKDKEKRSKELTIANKELLFQNEEKEKRAEELFIANQELVFQKNEIEKRETENKELEAFSYTVSHDLRAPLRHIGGFIDLLIKNNSSQLNETGLRYLNTISESSHEMGNLIDALLTFSRLRRTELQRTRLNSKSLVTRAFKTFSDELTRKNIELNISKLPDTLGDENLIVQVWVNLISNALKYTRNKEKAVIDIGGVIENGYTTFFIRDNGVGFDMKYVNKLFGVFQRLHKVSDFEGIGIGLANVNRIVMRHGGKCWAEGEVGKGATFSFSLSNN